MLYQKDPLDYTHMKQVLARLPDELVISIDVARGDIPRSKVILRALEAWLSRNERKSPNLPQLHEPDPSTLIHQEDA